MFPQDWVRSAAAEGVGTFGLCFVGILVATGGATPYALAHGLTILALVAALGHVSGGHFNPAVTLGMLLAKQIDVVRASVYWAAQIIGGIVAAVLVLLATDRAIVTAGTPVVAEGLGMGGAILLEALATFLLVLVVFGTIVDDRAPLSVYPFAIGLTITAGTFAIAPFTGAAINPVRGLAPALVSGEWGAAPAWLVGPLLGAVLAWALHHYVIAPPGVAGDVDDVAGPAEPGPPYWGPEPGFGDDSGRGAGSS